MSNSSVLYPHLSMLGKDSLFPFTGMFMAQVQLDSGLCSIIGRVHDTDIRKDFIWIREKQQILENLIQTLDGSSFRTILREVWDWFLSVKPHNQIVSMTIQIETEDTLYLSTMGTSGLWGLSKGTWYPLLGDGSAVLQDELLEGYPMLMQVESKPESVMVIPKPIKNQLPTVLGMQKYVYTVGGNQDVD